MLSRDQIKDYRMRSKLTYRDVAAYCNVSFQLIEMVENGKKDLTEFNYCEIIKGINGAKQAKKDGTFKQAEKVASERRDTKQNRVSTKKKNLKKQDMAGDNTNAKI